MCRVIRLKRSTRRNLADASSAVQDPGISGSQLPEIDCFRATNGDTAPASLHVHMVLYLWLWCCYHVVTTFISPTRYELFVIFSAMTGLVVSSYPSLRYREKHVSFLVKLTFAFSLSRLVSLHQNISIARLDCSDEEDGMRKEAGAGEEEDRRVLFSSCPK